MQEVFACGEAGFGEFGSEMEAHAANVSPAENLAVQIMEKKLQAANAQGTRESDLPYPSVIVYPIAVFRSFEWVRSSIAPNRFVVAFAE